MRLTKTFFPLLISGLIVSKVCGQSTLASGVSSPVSYNRATTGKYAAAETERGQYLQRLFKLVPKENQRLYKEFLDGFFVDYKGQRSRNYAMNFNKFISTVEYIDEAGDTVGMTDFHPAKEIVIATDTFVHVRGEGFFKVEHAPRERVKFVSHAVVTVVSRKELLDENAKAGAASKHDQFTTIYTPRDPTLLNEDVLLVTRRTVFLVDSGDRLFAVSASGFIHAFPKNRNLVENNIRARIRKHESIDFDNDDEVAGFLDFCNKLDKKKWN